MTAGLTPILAAVVTLAPALSGLLALTRDQAASNPQQWEAEIRAFERSDREHPPQTGAVLFIGSSSIRRWESLARDFPSHRVLNRGFGGSRIADSTHFVNRIVTPYRPRMIVLYAGDNDIAEGRTPDQVLADFDAFVARVRAGLPDVPIAFISIKPSVKREALREAMRSANEKIQHYASTHRNVIYVDVFTKMLGTDGKARPELFVDDGLHLNERGYALWTSIVGAALRL